MHLMLYRTYDAKGVNGELLINGALVCYTIELPWRDNLPTRSCIPEGTYVLKKRWSPQHHWHLEVTGVKERSFILMHPANDALRELRGCIAPVSILTAAGKGLQSRMAFDRLKRIVYPVMPTQTVLLTIQRKS